MTFLVFFLEEPSAREMLKGLLPKILPAGTECQYVVFEGKQDLEKRLPKRLRAWQQPDTRFVVLRDQDSGDCQQIKQTLVRKCQDAGKSGVLVRIVCRELESWYLGNLAAVANAIGPGNLGTLQHRAKYRIPDNIANASQELKKIAPSYQKISGSRAIGPYLANEVNRSVSFNVFQEGMHRLITSDGATP